MKIFFPYKTICYDPATFTTYKFMRNEQRLSLNYLKTSSVGALASVIQINDKPCIKEWEFVQRLWKLKTFYFGSL